MHGLSNPPYLRLATVDDAAVLADLHVRAWQWAYRGQLPDAWLDGLAVGPRELWRRTTLQHPPAEARTWVAEDAQRRVVGFADTGVCRDQDAQPGTAEVYALYLDPAVVGRGVGRALFSAAVDDLQQRGYRRATLWVLATNVRAQRFYAAAGWHPDGATKVDERPEGALQEVRYQRLFSPHAQETAPSQYTADVR